MSRRRKNPSRCTRCYRIERLEARQMLSADGLGVDCTRNDSMEQLAQSRRGYEIGLAQSGLDRHQQRGAIASLNEGLSDVGRRHDHHDSSRRNGDRRDGRDWRLDRASVHQDGREIPLLTVAALAEAELIPRTDLDLQPRLSVPAIRVSPGIETRVVFVITVPTRTSLDLVSLRSTSQTPRTESLSQTSAIDSPPNVTTTPQRSERTSADPPQSRTSLSQDQANAVEFVSLPQRDVDSIHTSAADAIARELRQVAGAVPSSDFAAGSFRFDDGLPDRWLKQSETIEDEFSRLDALLDAIASQRSKSSFPDSSARTSVAGNAQTSRAAKSPADLGADSAGMILLMPTTSIANRSSQVATQVFDEIDDSKVVPWTVGIGFYRALEVAGNAELAQSLIIASDIASAGMNAETELVQVEEANTSVRYASSSTSQAAGVVFCCLGVQYLRKRRKQPYGQVTSMLIRKEEGKRPRNC